MKLSEVAITGEAEVQISRAEAERWLKKLVLAVGSAVPEFKFKKLRTTDIETVYGGEVEKDKITINSQELPIKKLKTWISLDFDHGPTGFPTYEVALKLQTKNSPPLKLQTKIKDPPLDVLMNNVRKHLGEDWVIVLPYRNDIRDESQEHYAPAEWLSDELKQRLRSSS